MKYDTFKRKYQSRISRYSAPWQFGFTFYFQKMCRVLLRTRLAEKIGHVNIYPSSTDWFNPFQYSVKNTH